MSRATVSDEIVSLLEQSSRPLTTAEIVAEMDIRGFASSTVKAALGPLVSSGRVERPRHGTYALTNIQDEPAGIPAEILDIPLAEFRRGIDSFSAGLRGFRMISKQYITQITGVSSARVVCMIATGDNQGTGVSPGDVLTIARKDGEQIIDGALYVWQSRNGAIVVKRARVDGLGYVRLQGDRDEEPVATIEPDDPSPAFSVVGRIVRVEKPL